MKAFSPSGPAVKAYYGGPGWPQGGNAGAGGRGGWGAPKTLGNPDGATAGGGAYAAGGENANGPNQGGGGGTPPMVLITSDMIAVLHAGTGGAQLSTLLTAAGLLAQWEAGAIPVLTIGGDGLSGRPGGYWAISGVSTEFTNLDGVGLWIDTAPNSACTISIDSSQLRIYGAGGSGGAGNPADNLPGDGGTAILVSLNTGTGPIDINITNLLGAHTGRVFGGGGGGQGGLSSPGGSATGGNGGGGAGGWIGGIAGHGGGTPLPAATAGGVYDAANGGADDINVAGGAAGGSGVFIGGDGGGLAQAGQGGSFQQPGAAGFAVLRQGVGGTTTIVSGGAFVLGVAQ